MIDNLTPEQEALIPVYREKWRAIALSSEPIDRDKATDAVKGIYAAIGKKEPKIVFFDSPYAAHQNILLLDCLPFSLSGLIGREVKAAIQITLSQLNIQLWSEIRNFFRIESSSHFNWTIDIEITDKLTDEKKREGYISRIKIRQDYLAQEASIMDYCISGLSISWKENQYKWELYQSLVENCGWIYYFTKICYVCDRPRILSFDSQQRLSSLISKRDRPSLINKNF